ncbi:hypothetical protein GPA10_22540 [Streptomyces sp. p1417]|uniref:Uncharacterized protein n=1 Tax=Streptomyces typhae TaxID=2681492 RepID=A0A6L6X0Y0_9ACTN|nr:hypothetical protein [Streptomyces typhae]MVO87465.1 hypothetical protein [Streptomyces typhae]
MNELVAAGYVKRARLQDPETGRWVTITTVTDVPESPGSPTDRLPTVGLPTGLDDGGSPQGKKTDSKDTTTPTQPAPDEAQQVGAMGEGESTFLRQLAREMTHEARRILGRVSLHASLPLAASDVERLAPALVPWLRDDHSERDILQCLTANLPAKIVSVPGLVSHRLTNFTPERTSPPTPPRASVRATCETCRAPFPAGHCGGVCRSCQDQEAGTTAFSPDTGAFLMATIRQRRDAGTVKGTSHRGFASISA